MALLRLHHLKEFTEPEPEPEPEAVIPLFL
jgi:hypothetical protein